jgi:hypothetical protein
MYARIETENNLMSARTDEFAVLGVYARLGAVEVLSALRTKAQIMGTYSALSTTTSASCLMPRGSSFPTLILLTKSSASLMVLIAASCSRVSCLGFGREEIKFQTLG